MIRVALVISNLEFGGAQRQLIELVNSSADLNVEYYLVSLSDTVPFAAQLDAPHSITIIRKHWKLDFTVVFRLAKLLSDLDVDIVHGFLFDAEIACRLAARLSGGRLCVGSERNSNYRLKRIQVLAYHATRTMRQACIANSYSGAEFNAGLLGYPGDHYFVVPNGVDSERFRPIDRHQAAAALGIDPKYRWIGMIGSFKERKNHLVFFRVAKKLLSRFEDVRFLLVGDILAGGKHGSDAYRDALMEEVSALEIEKYCAFLGNRTDVELVYPACELTVLPSLHEGTPNVALESMSCAVPVVASDVSDNSRVVPDGRAGVIVAVNDVEGTFDAVSRLLESEDLPDLGRRARLWVKQEFSTSVFAKKMLLTYKNILRNRTPTTDVG